MVTMLWFMEIKFKLEWLDFYWRNIYIHFFSGDKKMKSVLKLKFTSNINKLINKWFNSNSVA